MKVLLVEDTAAVRDALAAALRARGYRVVPVARGADAVAAVARGGIGPGGPAGREGGDGPGSPAGREGGGGPGGPDGLGGSDGPGGPDGLGGSEGLGGSDGPDDGDAPDLVLLDLGLPDLDGVEVCRRIRARSAVPIIAVTARGHESARVLGLRSGADDYVVKPFSLDELTARMDAVLRRTAGHTVAPVVHAGPVEIDLGARSVTVDGVALTLRRKEFDLLAALARRGGRVATREDLLDDVWGLGPSDAGAESGARTLEVHVGALRQHFRRLGVDGVVVTVRGIGYRLAVS